MHVVAADNVAQALPAGLKYLMEHGRREESRAGPVIVAPGPVTTVYARPTERVLFSAVRDANPFFHLAEAMWMLAGRSDSNFLNHFVRDFGERFAEPGGEVHGAYGHRWRQALGIDQLDVVVERLRADPGSRQCVIQMWDAVRPGEDDFRGGTWGNDDLQGSWRDRPCNTHAYLRLRVEDGRPEVTGHPRQTRLLDLTVLCRSNDIIWGAYGANAVHFSVLQEYLAARIGVGVGAYYQVSNNYHAYEAEVDRLLNKLVPHVNPHTETVSGTLLEALEDNRYSDGLRTVPLVADPGTFDGEVAYLLNLYENLGEGPPDSSTHLRAGELSNPFLGRTVWPALMAHREWRAKLPPLVVCAWLDAIEAEDWATVCREWVARRLR